MPDESIVIPARFCGPPGCGNGGWVGGALARRLGGTVQVRLHRPIPLERSLLLRAEGPALLLYDGAVHVASAQGSRLHMDIPAPPTWGEAMAAVASPAATVHHRDHPFPHCFVCGPARAVDDGLRLFAAPVDGRGIWAAVWTPGPTVAGPDGRVHPEIVWAALDCPSVMPFLGDIGPALLGTMTTRRLDEVWAGRRYLLMSWSMGGDGRKRFGGSALFDDAEELVAAAGTTWIELT